MGQLEELRLLVEQGYQDLRRRCPDLPDLGGCVLLGKNYAHPGSRVLYLGINPGASPSTTLDTGRQPYNWLLDQHAPNVGGHAHWTNARKFFASSPILGAAFSIATFANCCPYRTASWSDLPERDRDILMALSRPPLRKMLSDCRPTLIVVAGKAGLRTLEDMLRSRWTLTKVVSTVGDAGGTYQWSAQRGTLDDREIMIAQVPHFSRANSTAKLYECAQWLSNIVIEAGATS